MAEFQKNKGWQNILYSKLTLTVLAIFVIIFSYNMVGIVKHSIETTKEKNLAEQKITDLKAEQDKLNAEIDSLKTDTGVEENIRDKFHLAKPGEGLVVIVSPKDEPAPLRQNFWQFLKNIFSKKTP